MKPKDYECNGIDEIQAAGEERTKHFTDCHNISEIYC
jgi:hypothetical protein